MRTYEAVETQIKLLIAEYLGFSVYEIRNEADIVKDLKADSLDIVELIMAVEEEFDIQIDDTALEGKVSTVQSIIDYACELLNIPHSTDSHPEKPSYAPRFPTPFSFRNEIVARINLLVKGEEGFADDTGRWFPVKEMLYDGVAKNKKRAINAVKLSKLSEITDQKLIDVYENVVRRAYTQR